MIIKKIEIENFGKFSGRSISFEPGFNMIFGKNEDGKSTLMAFIKMMFYGNNSGKSSDILKNLRKKYLPWNGAAMSGAVEFESMGVTYRLHKEFKKSSVSDNITVTNLSTGEKILVPPSEEIGQYFFDMDLGEFERSVFIDSYGGFSSDVSGDTLAMRISNLSVSGDESLSQSTVIRRISDAKEELISKSGKKGLLVEEKSKLEALNTKLEQLIVQQDSQHTLISDITKTQNEISDLESTLERLSVTQKTAVAKKDLVAFSALMEKYELLSALQITVNEYNIPETELRRIISECKKMKEVISRSYGDFLQNTESVIPDNEYTRLTELEKQLAILDSDREHINGIIQRTGTFLTETLSSTRHKTKTASYIFLGCSIFSVIAAVACAILFSPLIAIIPAIIFVSCFIMSFIFMNKNKNADNSIDVRLAQQEYENALRLLSFYGEDLSRQTFAQLTEECYNRKQTIIRDITEKLNYYGCSSIEELSKKTVSAQGILFASATDTANKLKTRFTETVSFIQPVDSYEQAEQLISEIEPLLNEIDTLRHDIDTLSKTVVPGKISPDFVKSQIDVLTKFIEDTKAAPVPLTNNPDVIKEELANKRRLLSELQSKIRLPEISESEIESQISDTNEKIHSYSERYRILELTAEAMDAAILEMSKGLGSHLSQKTGKYLEMMSNGKYKDVIVSRDLNVETRTDSSLSFHNWKYMSSAAIDRVYLALRLAATDIIAENHNSLPLFLDDILAQYDDESCENTLKFLKKYFEESGSVSQIFFFTCHNHIAEMANKIFTDINKIKL